MAVKPNGGRKEFWRVQYNDGEGGGDSKLSDHAEWCSHVNQRYVVPYAENRTNGVMTLIYNEIREKMDTFSPKLAGVLSSSV